MNKIIQRFSKINVFVGLIFSIILIFSFFFLATPSLDKKIIKVQRTYYIKSTDFIERVNLPRRSGYVVKIKYEFNNIDGAIVILNGNKLELRVSNKSDVTQTNYYYVPRTLVQEGDNLLKIKFYPEHPFNVDIRIKNYIKSFANGNIFLTTKDSSILEKSFSGLFLSGILFFVFSFGVWLVFVYFGEIFNLTVNCAMVKNILSFIPCTGLYFIFGITSIFTPFSLAITPSFLFISLFLNIFFFNIFLNSFALLHVVQETRGTYLDSKSGISGEVKDCEILPWFQKLIYWFKTEKFLDDCVLFFMFLLFFCAILLVFDMKWFAEQFAKIAYFTLVVSVIVKFIKFGRKEKTQK